MTEAIDLDALESQIVGSYDLSHIKGQDILALIAELRKEREERDFYRTGVEVFGGQIRDMGIAEFKQSQALSRAEGTIESAIRVLRSVQQKPGTHSAEAVKILTEYKKLECD